jgi:hypothetical protein
MISAYHTIVTAEVSPKPFQPKDRAGANPRIADRSARAG